MNYEQAKRLLLLHGPGIDDEDPCVFENGFLGCLRPYSGLRESNFHDVMQALLVVGHEIYTEDKVDRDVVHALWYLCDTARTYALRTDGMLQRNKLMSDDDLGRMTAWIVTIERISLGLLRGSPPHWEVERYAQYVIDFSHGENVHYFIPLMISWIEDVQCYDPSVAAEALGKIGMPARDALPALRDALGREYTYYTPVDRCTEEVRGHIRNAIQRIEG